MRGHGDKREAHGPSGQQAHDGFLELCAVSTTGELSEEERLRLQEHLATCAECRQALREFEAAVDLGMPALASELSSSVLDRPREDNVAWVEQSATGQAAQPGEAGTRGAPNEPGEPLLLGHRNGRSRASMNWSYVWMSLAAAVILAAALGIYSYQFGKHKGREVVETASHAPDTRVEALEQQISDAGHERKVLKAQVAQRDGMIAGLQRQIGQQAQLLAEIKSAQANLARSFQDAQAEKQQVAQERSGLLQKVDIAQASLEKSQTELDALKQERSQDESLAAGLQVQIKDLHDQLRDREQELGKQQDLLARDRDIRDLMGARELYIAEVYDVARDGTTQKPYGRVFYTKGKSLIFYAYDLDQQAGAKDTSTFQAWGRGGADRQQLLNLGVFYQDSAAKKRWVLKFDDPRMLEQLDAVFVTVEPHGGSRKPSNKPLLFASLRIDANHP